MIYLLMVNGLVGLAASLYGRDDDIRFIGGLAALLGLAAALLFPEAW
ncbi:hypothetical protein [Streptomyces atratus]|nr:hypothetical protein [Streptomyces atratus]